MQPPPLKTPAGANGTEPSTGMELDPNPDGFPQVKPTPCLVLVMTKGDMPTYLASFSSPNQKRKGLLIVMQIFLALEYEEIAPAVMPILDDCQHTPTHILQEFFVVQNVLMYM